MIGIEAQRDAEFYCRQCGMELLDGFERECPLCRTELYRDDDDVDFEEEEEVECHRCEKTMNELDFEHQSRWDYFAPSEFGDYFICESCANKDVWAKFPKYAADGLDSFTAYLLGQLAVQKKSLPKHRTVDDFREAVELYVNEEDSDVQFSYEELIRWIRTSIEVEYFGSWSTESFTPKQAEAWTRAGVSPYDVEEWQEWETSPKQIEELRALYAYDEDEPPPLEYKALGYGLRDLFQLLSSGFRFKDWASLDSLEAWLETKLPVLKIMELRTEMREFVREVSGRKSLLLEDGDTCDFDDVFEVIASLGEIRMSITVENVRRYAGMNPDEILATIDSALEPEQAREVARRGASSEEIGAALQFADCGFSIVDGLLLNTRGAKIGDIRKLQKLNYDIRRLPGELSSWELLTVPDILECVKSGMTTYELISRVKARADSATLKQWGEAGFSGHLAFQWLKIGLSLEEALPLARAGKKPDPTFRWVAAGIAKTEARKWIDQGFSIEMAMRWIKSGVKDAEVALRRQKAGIVPGD